MKRTLALVGIALAVNLWGCGEAPAPPTEPPLRPVRVAVVSSTGDMRERSFTGVSQSMQESRMSFRVGGTIVQLPVQVGDALKAGDTIARLNTSTYDLAVQQAEASLAQALANQRNSESNYSRVKELYENTNASRNDLDGARANAESARAQVRSARKSLEIAQLDRSYTQLDAASDCTVASLDVELNENVSAGNPVATVYCGGGIEVRLSVPESLIGGLEQGTLASVQFNALRDRELSGRITEVGSPTGGGAATFPVVVALMETDRLVRPGMAAEVTFEFGNGDSNSLFVPAAALINDERGTFVFVAEPASDGRATIARRDVQAGELTSAGIEILNGLREGDRVVTAGTTVIRVNQTVLLPQG